MGPKRFTPLFILIVASLMISVSSAGGQRRIFNKYAVHVGSMMKESEKKVVVHSEQAFVAHSRVLKANTNDYGSYDPSPSLSKPPFKLIPN